MKKLTESHLREIIREELVFEIGDTTDFYRWEPERADGQEFKVSFETENGFTYYVRGMQSHQRPDLLTVDFGVRKDSFFKKGGVIMTGEQNQFKVISTVIRVIETVWENRNDVFEESEKLHAIQFTAAPKDDEKDKEVTARAKLYRRFIEKQFPGARIYQDGRLFIITPKETRRS